jgi:DNA-binding NarL/FixJ family response regulator
VTARVLIVDDHELVRYALRTVLEAESDIEIMGEAGTGEAALECLEGAEVDLVLLDLRMPGMGGVEACRSIVSAHPDIRVVVLTSYDDDDEVFGVLSAGASGYLMKDSSPEAIVQTLRGVLDGNMVLDSAIARRVIDAGGSPRVDDPGLSDRELDVLALMARGYNNRRIAQELWISEPTVKTHVSHILRKLGQADRTQAVVDAIKRGLVKLPPRDGSSA